MSDPGTPNDAPPPPPPPPASHRGLKVVAAFALVLAIGGGAYGIASALNNGGTKTPTVDPSTTVPAPGPSRGGANGRTPAARPQASGTVQSVGSTSFVLKTTSGSSVTVDVTSKTIFSDGRTGSASYSEVKKGAAVAAYGTVSGSTLSATRVLVVPAGSRGGFAGGFRGGFAGGGTFGTVSSVGTNSFVISTFQGSSVTVDVSGTTTYSERGASSASFADVKAGVRVAVQGTGTGTVHATAVVILPAGGFGGRDGGGGSGGFGGGGGGDAPQ